ncbi:putative uncharacterized protein C3orf49 homolog [Ochotona princeps]|uniref:putative uncharacterized protein C3orf49 homolog n=1 Tax=Ochotona princeps TaxID=9978 RepID=UPI002714FD22|nr:putative uncharacterized protein C3orf49 homolog [Ochotona princeps]
MGKSMWCRRSKQLQEKSDSLRKKGVERVESTNLAEQNALVPKEESRSEIDVGFQESQQNQKKSMKKSKSFLRKILPRRATVQPDVEAKTQLGAEAEMEEVAGGSHLPAGRAAKRFWRMPVRQGQQKEVLSSSKKRLHFPVLKKKKHGLEESLQKSALPLKNLQMQVDDCKQIMIDQVRKQVDQRNAELEHYESVSDQLLQCSRQFQRVSKRAAWKSKLKNMFFCLSPCCCFCDSVFDWL